MMTTATESYCRTRLFYHWSLATITIVLTIVSMFGVSSLSDLSECPPDTWKCRTTADCIPISWVCNDRSDCPDQSDSDKVFCLNYTCPAYMQKCDDNIQCLMRASVCNGWANCADGSDEAHCVPHKCPDGFWRCADNFKCIESNLICDGRTHCFDGSDEHQCQCDINCVKHGCLIYGKDKCDTTCQGGFTLDTYLHKCVPAIEPPAILSSERAFGDGGTEIFTYGIPIICVAVALAIIACCLYHPMCPGMRNKKKRNSDPPYIHKVDENYQPLPPDTTD